MGRHRSDEILREAEKERLVRQAEREGEKPLWERVLTWVAGTAHAVIAADGASTVSETGGRMTNATGAGEVPGL